MARYQLKGWKLSTWIAKNKDILKVLVVFLAGYNYWTGFSWTSFSAAGLAIVGKLVIDTLDYWQSE